LQLVTLGDSDYLITSGSGIAACAGTGRARGSMHEAAAPRTTIPETALRLEISQVAFRGGALLRHAKRIFLGSDGHRYLIGGKKTHREISGALKLSKLNTSETHNFSHLNGRKCSCALP